MLQQWHKSVTIALTPESIAINSGDKVSRVIELETNSSWSQILTELENNGSSITSGKVRIILSNNMVRYAVLPWQADIYSQQDWQSLAENHLRNVYGGVVDSWNVNVAIQGYGKSLIISAIDQDLLLRLENIAQKFNWKIDAVDPALMSVFNQYASQFKSNDYLLMVEPQRALLVEMDNNGIIDFSLSSPVSGQELMESSNLINRSLLLQSRELKNKLHVFGVDGSQLNIESDNIVMNTLGVDNSTMSSMLVELK